mmetsp:Transcript_9092/g.28951  ORF Transcript_9092/g.28951 Transcript_9092/m.28951 type:complete len:81 (+) Transcript_9092:202-444(+)
MKRNLSRKSDAMDLTEVEEMVSAVREGKRLRRLFARVEAERKAKEEAVERRTSAERSARKRQRSRANRRMLNKRFSRQRR